MQVRLSGMQREEMGVELRLIEMSLDVSAGQIQSAVEVVSNILCKRSDINSPNLAVGAVGTVGKRSLLFHRFHQPGFVRRAGRPPGALG